MSRTADAEAFLLAYAERSGSTRDEVMTGRVVATCACGYEACEGWQIIPENCLLPWREEEVVIRDTPREQ
jgi:hypothetical protein